jgi:hypothetical protein
MRPVSSWHSLSVRRSWPVHARGVSFFQVGSGTFLVRNHWLIHCRTSSDFAEALGNLWSSMAGMVGLCSRAILSTAGSCLWTSGEVRLPDQWTELSYSRSLSCGRCFRVRGGSRMEGRVDRVLGWRIVAIIRFLLFLVFGPQAEVLIVPIGFRWPK